MNLYAQMYILDSSYLNCLWLEWLNIFHHLNIIFTLQITHMFRCARIQGLDTIEGLLVFVKEHFYIIDGFTLLRTKEIADIDSLPAEYVTLFIVIIDKRDSNVLFLLELC